MRPPTILLALLLASAPAYPQAARELTPPPKAEPTSTSAAIPLSRGSYRCFAVPKEVTGPVTWDVVEGEGFVSTRETTRATTVIGVVHGQTDPTEAEYPAGALVVWGRTAGTAKVFAYATVDGKARRVLSLSFTVDGSAPQPPPGPKPPDPKPPEPKPAVETFRVVLAYETGKTLTPVQNSVLNGRAVQDWLQKNTTPEGGLAGFRRFDKDTDASNDQPEMRRLWAAVQPKITSVPCAAIEVNGRVEIVPFEPTPEAMVALLKKYKGN